MEIDEGCLDHDELGCIYETKQCSHKRSLKTGTTVFIPHNILKSPKVIETAVRNKITPTALSSLFHSIICAMSGDSSRVDLSYTTAYRCIYTY